MSDNFIDNLILALFDKLHEKNETPEKLKKTKDNKPKRGPKPMTTKKKLKKRLQKLEYSRVYQREMRRKNRLQNMDKCLETFSATRDLLVKRICINKYNKMSLEDRIIRLEQDGITFNASISGDGTLVFTETPFTLTPEVETIELNPVYQGSNSILETYKAQKRGRKKMSDKDIEVAKEKKKIYNQEYHARNKNKDNVKRCDVARKDRIIKAMNESKDIRGSVMEHFCLEYKSLESELCGPKVCQPCGYYQ